MLSDAEAHQASRGVFPAGRGRVYQGTGWHRQEWALVMELLHRYSGLKISVVYRVPDGLNQLNEQRLIAERFGGWMRVW